MRKTYLDNIRWITVVLVVFYHVFYMYNGQGIPGTLGKITSLDVQYYDLYQYIVYPWFMALLFIVSGISARHSLNKLSTKEFIKRRTVKLLVPSTLGLFTFQFIQGYVNMRLSDAVDIQAPLPVRFFICCLSGIGVLWYIQMLWIFSLVIALIRKIDKDRFLNVCKKTPWPVLILIAPLFYGAGQILNTPMIVCYRFGLYLLSFLLGYFVFSHDEVIEKTKKILPLTALAATGLGIAFCYVYFGQVYADNPVYRSPLYLFYGWFACLTVIGAGAKFLDFETGFTKWMSSHSWGLYIFHYLGISLVALYIARPGYLPAWACYLLSTIAGFVLSYILYFVISKIPFFRWTVLGISKKKKEKKNVQG